MKSILYNQKGEKVGEVQLPKEIFNISLKADLLHQVVRYYESLQREIIAKAKDRSEVRGGGRKPWRQKGTGKARHGSNRSPIWKGGGVTFGPITEKKYQKNINKKMLNKALKGTLSKKLKDEEILFLDKIETKDEKTKSVSDIINKLSKIKKDIKNKKIIFILNKKDEKFLKASKNIKKAFTIPSNSLNAHFLLKAKYLVIEKDAIKNIK